MDFSENPCMRFRHERLIILVATGLINCSADPNSTQGWGVHTDDFGEFSAVILGNSHPLLLVILHPMLTPLHYVTRPAD
jgi:hypothetical protein